MNVEIALPVDFIALDTKSPFILAIDQDVAQFEILDENDGCGVIQNVLQPLFACAKRPCGPSRPPIPPARCCSYSGLCALLFHSGTRKVIQVSCQDLFRLPTKVSTARRPADTRLSGEEWLRILNVAGKTLARRNVFKRD